VVFQPFAGSLADRIMPPGFMEGVVKVLLGLPCRVFLVTRSYPRKNLQGKTIHADEDARRFEGGNITVLEHLTVPATLNLIRTCAAFVGSWSSLLQAAWFEDKPAAVFYPPLWHDVVNRTGYAFGLDRETTWHCDWNNADLGSCADWLRQRL
jgi:hypothetical protein